MNTTKNSEISMSKSPMRCIYYYIWDDFFICYILARNEGIEKQAVNQYMESKYQFKVFIKI